MKPLFTLLSITCLSLAACKTATQSKPEQAKDANSQDAYFANLTKLCGQEFVGESVFPENDPDHSFAGKTLVATFAKCTDTEIRVPFVVGEDHSRTWIISKTDKGLLLKHDHRHEDGTPDEVTMYGGYAGSYKDQQGTRFKQYFKADAHTAELIPAASTNVWMLEYNPESKELTYYLERNAEARYKAVLK